LIAVNAGGSAEDDCGEILSKTPSHLHERSPFYVGSVNMIQGLRSCWLAD